LSCREKKTKSHVIKEIGNTFVAIIIVSAFAKGAFRKREREREREDEDDGKGSDDESEEEEDRSERFMGFDRE
jgi:ribosomal protein L12E/L44/L45/RPP1/RPP2